MADQPTNESAIDRLSRWVSAHMGAIKKAVLGAPSAPEVIVPPPVSEAEMRYDKSTQTLFRGDEVVRKLNFPNRPAAADKSANGTSGPFLAANDVHWPQVENTIPVTAASAPPRPDDLPTLANVVPPSPLRGPAQNNPLVAEIRKEAAASEATAASAAAPAVEKSAGWLSRLANAEALAGKKGMVFAGAAVAIGAVAYGAHKLLGSRNTEQERS